jgi:HAD superfamily hydrolase (TIGR01509 family)
MTHKMVIFDMDGVLIDSEGFYKEINYQYFEELGVDITDEEYESFIGISASLMWDYIKKKGNVLEEVATLKKGEKERKYKYLTQKPLAPMPGILSLLEKLKEQNYSLSLASSSDRKNIEVIVQKLDIASYFNYIVSGEEVQNGKPAPDIFLKAATQVNVAPKDCYVIEDSNNGARAAKAAGMQCVGLRSPNSGQQDLSMCDLIIDSFAEEHLKKIFSLIEK